MKRGQKSSDIEVDQLQKARQSLFECISHKERIPKNTSIGHLQGNYVRISQNKGSHLHTMGFSHKGAITLYLEEAAFLVARNALIVHDKDGEMLEFEDFCEYICQENDGWVTYDKYQVYAYLKRLGFIVMRSKNGNINSKPNCIEQLFFGSSHKPLVWDYLCRDYGTQ